MQRGTLDPDSVYSELCFDFPLVGTDEAEGFRDAMAAELKGGLYSKRFLLRRRFLDGVVYQLQGRTGKPADVKSRYAPHCAWQAARVRGVVTRNAFLSSTVWLTAP